MHKRTDSPLAACEDRDAAATTICDVLDDEEFLIMREDHALPVTATG